jgi:hypothetical protein
MQTGKCENENVQTRSGMNRRAFAHLLISTFAH